MTFKNGFGGKRTAIFIIVLMINVIFYTPIVMGGVSITRSQGEDDIKGVVNADEDTWGLEVKASKDNNEEVNPSDLSVNGASFDKCREAPSQGYLCYYNLSWSNSIPAYTYDVQVNLGWENEEGITQRESTKGELVAESSPPSVRFNSVEQKGSSVFLNFSASDQSGSSKCAGLEKIVISRMNDGSETRISSINRNDLENKGWTGCSENSELIKIEDNLPTSSQPLSFKAVATDRLGFSSTAKASLDNDFDARDPEIVSSSFKPIGYEDYLPDTKRRVNLTINISDDGNELESEISNSNIRDQTTECTDEDNDRVFQCVWNNIIVDFGENPNFQIKATDGVGRTSSKRLALSTLEVDNTPPSVKFFGTTTPGQKQYASTDMNRFRVVFEEAGSGIDNESVEADFSELEPETMSEYTAENCTKTGASEHTCYWNVEPSISDGETKTIGLAERPKDKVGNIMTRDLEDFDQEIIIDDNGPKITNLTMLPTPDSQGDPISFISGGKTVDISFDIKDPQLDGERIFINTSEVMQSDKIQVDIENDCDMINLTEGKYRCSVSPSETILHGIGEPREISVIAYDLADNKGSASLEKNIRKVEGEIENPNFWKKESGETRCSPSALDAGAMRLTNQRIFCDFNIQPSSNNVEMLNAYIKSCKGNTKKLARTNIIGDLEGSSNPETQVMLEFNRREFGGIEEIENDTLDYKCKIGIRTGLGSGKVVNKSETKNISIEVPLRITEFAKNNVAEIGETIKEKKDKIDSSIGNTIGSLASIVKIARQVCQTYNVLRGAYEALNAVLIALQTLYTNPFSVGSAIISCQGITGAQTATAPAFSSLEKVCGWMDCSRSTGDILGSVPDLGFSNYLPKSEGKLLSGNKAVSADSSDSSSGESSDTGDDSSDDTSDTDDTSSSSSQSALGSAVEEGTILNSPLGPDPYENIYSSMYHMCLPAIVHNMEKVRQIKCREVYCLENEVKQGLATVSDCEQLESMQMCKYFLGDALQIMPLAGPLLAIIDQVKRILSDPLGLVFTVSNIGCTYLCSESSSLSAICGISNTAQWFASLTERLGSLPDKLKKMESVGQGKDYCKSVDLGEGVL